MLERTLESPLDCKEIKPVNPKENQFWIFIGRTDAEGEAPILWPPDGKNWLMWKDPDAEKDWKQAEGMTEDEMVGWYHWPNGYKFEQGLGDCEGQGSLVCCSPWGHKELDTTKWLNWTELNPTERESETEATPSKKVYSSQPPEVSEIRYLQNFREKVF